MRYFLTLYLCNEPAMKKLFALCLIVLPLSLQARVEPREGEQPITPEPQVTIVQDGDNAMQVHQINGKIYGIRVIPKNAPPYNLVDTNGNGEFIRDSADRILVPEWVLISW